MLFDKGILFDGAHQCMDVVFMRDLGLVAQG